MLMIPAEARLDALRRQLEAEGLDGFVVPLSDEHMSEYVGSYAQRLAWLTGFPGSAGTAVVLKDKAAMFVDGRYTLQVRDQVDGRLYAYESVPQTSPAKWIAAHAPEGARIGYDGWLHGKRWLDAATKALADKAIALVPVERNPIDAIWAEMRSRLGDAVVTPIAASSAPTRSARSSAGFQSRACSKNRR